VLTEPAPVAALGATRPRLLLAPVTVTPTKPLTPSHVKAALWLDVLYKATHAVADVDYLWSSRMANLAGQTLGFWHYLDRNIRDVDFRRCSAAQIGEWYTDFHKAGTVPGFDELRPYAEAVECGGPVHPASARILEIWQRELGMIGVFDPTLAPPPAGIAPEETLRVLRERDLCVDTRATGGLAYLDGTAHGLPLRALVTPDGRPTYLLWALSDLLPALPDHDEVVLVADRELAHDYVLVERVIGDLGTPACRLLLGRVPLDGVVGSARDGGWRQYTLDAIIDASLRKFGLRELRLGIRLYFIGVLAAASPQSLRTELLRRCLRRARRILDEAGDPVPHEEYVELLRSMLSRHGYVDPYRLTVSMLGRERPRALRNVLESVYVG
jgi:hypothetical protein